LLLAYQLKIPPAKIHALHYTTVTFWIHDSVVSVVTRVWGGQSRNHCSTPRDGKIFLSSAKHPDQLWGPTTLLFNVEPPLILHLHGKDTTAAVY